MMLTDREWLRFVTMALVAGGALGAVYTSALFLRGHAVEWAIVGGVIGTGVIALGTHVVIRHLIDEASEPPASESDPATTEETA